MTQKDREATKTIMRWFIKIVLFSGLMALLMWLGVVSL